MGKISNYCLDISKYFLTAVFAAALLVDLGDKHWILYILYILCGVLGSGLFFVGLYLGRIADREKNKNARDIKGIINVIIIGGHKL